MTDFIIYVKEKVLSVSHPCSFSGWTEQCLLTTYHLGLEPTLRLHLSAYNASLVSPNFTVVLIKSYSSITAPLTSLLKSKPGFCPGTLIPTPKRHLHHHSIIDTPQSRQAIYSRSECFYICCGSGVVTAAGEAFLTPSMFLLLKETYPSRAEL